MFESVCVCVCERNCVFVWACAFVFLMLFKIKNWVKIVFFDLSVLSEYYLCFRAFLPLCFSLSTNTPQSELQIAFDIRYTLLFLLENLCTFVYLMEHPLRVEKSTLKSGFILKLENLSRRWETPEQPCLVINLFSHCPLFSSWMLVDILVVCITLLYISLPVICQ